MARKLAISDKVLVPVTVVIPNPVTGRNDTFKFHLTCDRLDGPTLQKQVRRDDLSVDQFILEIVTGWDGQKLVLEDDGTPSAFSRDALQDLLAIAGVPPLCFKSYLQEVMAKEKN